MKSYLAAGALLVTAVLLSACGPAAPPTQTAPLAATPAASPAAPPARVFSGPSRKENADLHPTTVRVTTAGCATLAAATPSSADRLPAFTLTSWSGGFLGVWDPKSATLSSSVGDILSYAFAAPRDTHNGEYQISGYLTTRIEGVLTGNIQQGVVASWPVCAGRPKAAARGFAYGGWIYHDPIDPNVVQAAQPALSTAGCATRTTNPRLSTPPTFTITQAGTVVATWDARKGELRGPVGGITAYDFALSFAPDGRAHVAGHIVRPDTEPQPFTGTWPVCP